jgi:hypothetical protein
MAVSTPLSFLRSAGRDRSTYFTRTRTGTAGTGQSAQPAHPQIDEARGFDGFPCSQQTMVLVPALAEVRRRVAAVPTGGRALDQ